MTEARRQFRRELAELEARALGAIELVIDELDRTIEALEHQDIELGQIVAQTDLELDARCMEIHQGLLSLLALQAPVAGDLRMVAALLHVIKHAERMGNQCVSIVALLPLSGHEPPVDAQILERALAMGRFARAEVVQCRRSFAERDVAMAEDLVKRDSEVNRLNREIFRLAIEAGDDSDVREWAMIMTLVARAFERVGDNAVDIGEQTAFLVTGLFREFSDGAHVTVA
ncbi:MAG: phosphate transport system protein [Solirubrobacteraceae bacterium]|jgi:phosphate transport system protein|nr:phosphate transport system protein [Solirubrobacteraceae bacterium]